MKCPKCHFEIPEGSKFCNNCGYQLIKGTEELEDTCVMDSERKLVTVMFSDMSGYTAMTERLDPEEVKSIMSRIFGKITEIIKSYDGFIERFIGDAVMVVFGVPKAHEDDPIRAIRAAVEIHNAVKEFSPQLEAKIDRSLTMHTGLNTGLVVTGEVDIEKGTHGLTGDAINLASRLEGLAKSDEILVGESTYQLTKRHFNFEALEPTQVKGKKEPVPAYKMVSLLDHQVITKTLKGVQAQLIGRETEMGLLMEAIENLKHGMGSIISIVGHAGTGKSRLAREFKSKLKPEDIQWLEGHAYPYKQNTAYYPLTNLLTHAFQIREGDRADEIRDKVESGVKALLWDKPEAIKYLGSLFSLRYDDIDEMSPEHWQKQLHLSAQQLLEALASRGPTVILFEDLHWADESFIELLYFLLESTQRPVMFLCVYRHSFSLFPDGKPISLKWPYHEIRIGDLSGEQTQAMLHSLLNSKLLPDELRYFIKIKAEGNPFYLEEVVNSLIETEVLKFNKGVWNLTKSLNLEDVPATIQGVLTARLDRLEKETKRILQEASVIGRAFFYEVLNRVSKLTTKVDECLLGLENLDLIRTRSRKPDLEYIFKHALTQEVVYNGLLKKERQEIHERIGLAIEQLFRDRLPEFYETLAFHFLRGISNDKAVAYLIKSGEKNLSRHSIHEAHGYFQSAFDLLANKPDRSRAEDCILVDVLNNWGYAYYYRGDFKNFVILFEEYEELARLLDDSSRYGMFCVWLGTVYYMNGVPVLGYEYLTKALSLGEQSGNQKVIGYACTWLSWICAELGRPREGIDFGKRAIKIGISFPADQYLYFKPMAGIGVCYFVLGYADKMMRISKDLLSHGEKTANSRSIVMAYFIASWANFSGGDMQAAIENAKKSMAVAKDPYYGYLSLMPISAAYVLTDQIKDAKETSAQGMRNFNENHIREQGAFCELFYGVSLIAEGQMSAGMRIIDKVRTHFRENRRHFFFIVSDLALGKVYSEIAFGPKPSLSVMIKNIGFLLKHAPFAGKKAADYFKKAIDSSEKISSLSLQGQACLNLGLLYKCRREKQRARECISQAVELFNKCDARTFLKQAQQELAQL